MQQFIQRFKKDYLHNVYNHQKPKLRNISDDIQHNKELKLEFFDGISRNVNYKYIQIFIPEEIEQTILDKISLAYEINQELLIKVDYQIKVLKK